jgi:hypothetical protein
MAKRFLSMLALAFILQLSWGVVSAYCMHESGKASQHFGHHQHQHQGATAAGDDDNSPPAKKGAAHPDCASCSHSSLAVFAWSADFAQPLSSNHQLLAPLSARPAPYLGLPERPQWTAAA